MLKELFINLLSRWYKFRAQQYADIDNRPYKVFRFGTHFEVLNAKEIDARKLSQKRYVRRFLAHNFATGATILDFDHYCIYTANPNKNNLKRF